MKWAGMAAALCQQYFLREGWPLPLARARAPRAPLPPALYPGSKFTNCLLIPIKFSFPPLTFPPTHPPTPGLRLEGGDGKGTLTMTLLYQG